MKEIKRDNGNNIKIFTDDIDENTYHQIDHFGNYDAYKDSKIRIMPDCHMGNGCTIGTTMTINDKVSPNLIGVDIGCIDSETEYLTSKGWKKISDFVIGDDVLEYNKKNDTASFVYPINYIVKKCDYFFHFKNKKGLDQMLSEEHKMLIWKGYQKKGYNLKDYSTQEVYNLNNKLNSGYYGIKTSFNFNGNGIDITDNNIKIDVMVSADGTLRKNNKIELHFSKKRKIERCKKLLNNSRIEYKEYKGKDNSVYIIFLDEKNNFTKNLNKYWDANQHQLKIIADECLLWDGHKGYRSYFSSTNKINIDIIQFAFSSNNIRAGISTIKNNKWNDNFIVTPTKNNIIGVTNTIKKVKSNDGKKYCFTVPSGYFIARRNGKIFITGNCGMFTVKLKEKEDDINLKEIDNIINSRSIPSGFNIHKRVIYDFDFSDIRVPDNYLNIERAKRSIGTLGGGNHFIELDKGKDGSIYLIIHSGSRNLGLKVNKYYNKLAIRKNKEKRDLEVNNLKENIINKLKRENREKDIQTELKKHSIPEIDKNLAYLSGDDLKDYLHDIKIIQKFAVKNRRTIADIILNKSGLNEESSFETIHNYIDDDNILRKGAISARKSERVLIPINMRDGCIIATGKGNSDWNYSAPHGAGRIMSRNDAYDKLNLNDFKETMKDIYTTSVSIDTIDEAPNAYKPIDEIINNIKDTVDIDEIIKPIYNYKDH